jgi:hypothetical protein
LDYVDVPAPASAYVVPAAFNGEFVDKVIAAESGGNALARPCDPKTGKLLSSAFGAGQFIEATWLELVKKHRPDLAVRNDQEVLDLRSDFELSREMTIKFAEENRTHLIEHGFDPTDAALYLAHFAGRTGAVKLLKAHRDTPVEKILSPEAIEANRFLKGHTSATLYAWAQNKMNVEVGPLVTRSPTLEQLQTLRAELARKRSVYADSHPDIKALRNQIAALEALDKEAGSTKQVTPQLETLSAELARKRSVYTDSHPDIQALRNQIAALEALDKEAGSAKQVRVSSSAKVTPYAEIPGCGAKPAKDDTKEAPKRPEREARLPKSRTITVEAPQPEDLSRAVRFVVGGVVKYATGT